ncbi:MAG: CBS domain-containing protein [Burkholderiales bacterium]
MHTLKDVMSRDVKVVSPETTIREAARAIYLVANGDFEDGEDVREIEVTV